MVKQSNKQTTKVIVKIGGDVIKRKRTRRNKKVQPPPPPPPPQFRPQSFGTLAPQNTSLNAFSSNIQSQLDNLLKSQSDLNTIVNKLRSEQRPEENEGQNAQIVSGLNLNSEEPIDYEELIHKPELKPEPTDEEYYAMATDEEKQKYEDIMSNLQKEAEKAGNKSSSSSSSTGRGRSRERPDSIAPVSREMSRYATIPSNIDLTPPVDPLADFRIPRGGKKGRGGRPPKPETIDPNK